MLVPYYRYNMLFLRKLNLVPIEFWWFPMLPVGGEDTMRVRCISEGEGKGAVRVSLFGADGAISRIVCRPSIVISVPDLNLQEVTREQGQAG